MMSATIVRRGHYISCCTTLSLLLGVMCVASAGTPSSLYLTDDEEAALCAYYVAQFDCLRDTGSFGTIAALTTTGPPYLESGWQDQLGRYEFAEDDIYPGYYRFVVALAAKPGSGGAGWLTMDWLGNWDARTSRRGEQLGGGRLIDCTERGLNPERQAIRVMDDLLSISEALWMYWRVTGGLPLSLDDTGFAWSGYLIWPSYNGRWGYQYRYSSDGQQFSVAAWPDAPKAPGAPAFYCDQTGILRSSLGAGAGPTSPVVVESLPAYPAATRGAIRNEQTALAMLCNIFEAQEEFQRRNGQYAGDIEGLISAQPPLLPANANDNIDGYSFFVFAFPQSYTGFAYAEEYGVAGFRGFFLDQTGTMHAQNMGDAFHGSPIIGKVCEIDESFQPRGESLPGPARADADGDYRISLSELLALVQIFNLGEYHCGTDEPYAAGPGARACAALEFDIAPADWALDLAELLRVIQLYNGGAYFPCPGSEDGLCVPLEPVF